MTKNAAITLFCKTHFCLECTQNEYHIIFTQSESGNVLATRFSTKPENLSFQYQIFNEFDFPKDRKFICIKNMNFYSTLVSTERECPKKLCSCHKEQNN